jgi:hypothetical protein
MRRSTLIPIIYGLTGVLIPATMRFTGALTSKPAWARTMFIVDVTTLLIWGIIITYLIFTREK